MLGAVLGALVLVALVALSAVSPVVAEALAGDAPAVADPDARRRLGLPVLVALVAVVGETACLLRVLAAEPVDDEAASRTVVAVPRSAT